jgi:transposase
MTCYGIRDDPWERIRDLLPGKVSDVGATARDDRRFVEAVLYGETPWRDLPERFGDWKNTHRRFSRWAKAGVWERVLEHLAADGNNQYAMIDCTIVQAHQHGAGALRKS